jgi:glycosyltransferase involved in cell wall biosynthesis
VVLAKAMADFAGSKLPKVLQNVFPLAERELLDGKTLDRKYSILPSIHWYSQTIGPGRGLEFLVKTLGLVNTPVELHLRGNLFGSFKEELMALFPFQKGHKIYFHALVPHKELLSRIQEHDIGLATEEYSPDSRNLTITNKILQYLLAGIAVVASDTLGQKEVAEQAPGSVFLFRNSDSQSLADVLNGLLSDKAALITARTKALEVAIDKFCWEKQEKLLVDWIKELI